VIRVIPGEGGRDYLVTCMIKFTTGW
jgi:hypothetical protein